MIYLELIEARVLVTVSEEDLEDHDMDSVNNKTASTEDIPFESRSKGEALLPSFGLMRLYYWSDEQSVAKRLWNLAERCEVSDKSRFVWVNREKCSHCSGTEWKSIATSTSHIACHVYA